MTNTNVLANVVIWGLTAEGERIDHTGDVSIPMAAVMPGGDLESVAVAQAEQHGVCFGAVSVGPRQYDFRAGRCIGRTA